MEDRTGGRKAENDERRGFFAANLRDLIGSVLRMGRQDAAKALGVDYGWLRKACSVGLSRADRRSTAPLTKIAERFHLAVDDLWTPVLVGQIWAGGYLPDVRDYFVREFRFDQFVANSKLFREAVEDLEDARALGHQPGLPVDKFRTVPVPIGAGADNADGVACGQLLGLLKTGRYEYLRSLLRDLSAAEERRGTEAAGDKG